VRSLLLLLLLLSTSAWSQVKHLVFDLEGVLIQGIPAKNYDAFSNKDQMIRVARGGRNYHYYILPFVSQLLNHYQKQPSLVFHIASNHNRSETLDILKAIKLPKPIDSNLAVFFTNNGVNNLLTLEDKKSGQWDLLQLTSDLKNVLFITARNNILVDSQIKNEFFLGKPYYYFETFAQAQQERTTNPSSANMIPASEEEWNLDQRKIPYLFQHLQQANLQSSSNLIESLAHLKPDRDLWTAEGLNIALYNFAEEVLQWKYNSNNTEVIGCGVYSTSKSNFLKNVSIEKCIEAYSTKKRLKVNRELVTIERCELQDEAKGALIKTLPLEDCLEELSSELSPFWQGDVRVSCAEYYQNLFFVRNVDDSRCDMYHIIEKSDGTLEVKAFFESNGRLVEGVYEILTAREGSVIDSRVYSSYPSALIGHSLIQWIHATRELHKTVSKPFFDFKNDTHIVMAVNYSNFDKIMRNGFLNQHQTGTTNGSFDPKGRAQREDAMLNLRLEPNYSDYGSVVNQVRPKYAYMMIENNQNKIEETNVAFHYGNVFVKFKEEVKNQATFTPGDSLDMGASERDTRTFSWKGSDIIKIQRRYWETQIWGKLEKDKIDYVIVNCPGQNPLTSSEIRYIKGHGLTVYNCQLRHSWAFKSRIVSGVYRGIQL
jgi:hypothetical protein